MGTEAEEFFFILLGILQNSSFPEEEKLRSED